MTRELWFNSWHRQRFFSLPSCPDHLWNLFTLLSVGCWQLLSLSLQLDTRILAKKSRCRYQLIQEAVCKDQALCQEHEPGRMVSPWADYGSFSPFPWRKGRGHISHFLLNDTSLPRPLTGRKQDCFLTFHLLQPWKWPLLSKFLVSNFPFCERLMVTLISPVESDFTNSTFFLKGALGSLKNPFPMCDDKPMFPL